MDAATLASKCDHTLLKPEATLAQIQTLCDEGMAVQCASVCIPPAFVSQAADYVAGRLKICTVIGFPNGYSTTAAKVFETREAVANGADEIDMVIRIGWAKEGKWDLILEEIQAVRAACEGRVLKVIVEACLMTEEEKVQLCHVVSQSGADFIKTSTGFSTGGATPEDVALFRRSCAPHVKIKASGGIRTLADAEEFLRLGADRLGTSAIVKLIQKQQPEGH